MIRPTLAVPSSTAALPNGYRYGAHVSGEGWSGWYVIRESDGATCQAVERPDYDTAPDRSEIDAAIAGQS